MILKTLGRFQKRFFSSSRKLRYAVSDGPVVKVREGKLRGSVEKLQNGTEYYSFKGIPFAEPPVGSLRFKAPLPPKPWQGIFDATKHGPRCPQLNMITRTIMKGDDNCLHLNVYTKSLQPSSKLPVMVHIYFGAYRSGYSDISAQGPDFLLPHDVVLVTFNFRGELLGFLCLDTPEVPGNAGLKDQVAALKWVQNNIQQFGGDRDNVTIFGCSSGASSVTYHMLSPMSEGLFHKAIAQSGVSINEWAISRNAKERSFKAGKILGLDTNDPKELLSYLQKVPAEKMVDRITHKTMTQEEIVRDFPAKFCPVIEKEFKNVQPFLTKDPLELIMSGNIHKVPLIIGHCEAEGRISVSSALKKERINYINNNPTCTVREELLQSISEEKAKEYGDRIKRFYVGDKEWSEDISQALCDFTGDVHFVYSIHRFIHFYSNVWDNIFMYRFCFETEVNLLKEMFGFKHIKGATHTEDEFYIFSRDVTKKIYEERPEIMQKVYTVTKLWTDFAKTGEPTPDPATFGVKWRPFNKNTQEYLSIDDPLKMVAYENIPEMSRILFWNKLYAEAGLPSIKFANK